MGSAVIRRDGTDRSKVAVHNSPCATLGPVVLNTAMLRKRSCHRIISWLAFIAMGVVAVLPTVSRALASPAALFAFATQEACPAHHRAAAPGQPSPPVHGLDACAYCSLTSHSPVVIGPAITRLQSLPAMPFMARQGDQQLPFPTSPEAHSRGPPLT